MSDDKHPDVIELPQDLPTADELWQVCRTHYARLQERGWPFDSKERCELSKELRQVLQLGIRHVLEPIWMDRRVKALEEIKRAEDSDSTLDDIRAPGRGQTPDNGSGKPVH